MQMYKHLFNLQLFFENKKPAKGSGLINAVTRRQMDAIQRVVKLFQYHSLVFAFLATPKAYYKQ
jgi:hypothetical protein